MNNVIIRKAKISDLPAIEKLLIELIGVVENKEGVEIDAFSENCRSIINDDNYFIFVAETNETIVGMINVSVRKTIIHPSESALIDELIVTESYRGKGIGKQLVYSAIAESKKIGCCEIEVSTELTNKKAISFYKKCGLEEMGLFLEKDL